MNWNLSTRTGLYLCLLISCLSSSADPGQASKSQLFDGKSFEGWEGDTQKTFRIEDGAVVGGSLSAKVPRNEFLCTSRRSPRTSCYE